MTDAEFKNAVLRKEISFQHGSIIKCALNIYKKFDEIGNVIITGYSVVTVIEISNDAISAETAQGRRYREHRRFNKNQEGLFEDS